MAEIQYWNGNSTFTSGKTPFGIYDSDPIFATDADKNAKFCAYQMGYPMQDVELQDTHFYTAFESATLAYSNEINKIKLTDNYINLENTILPTGFDINKSRMVANLGNVFRLAKQYGSEVGVGGSVDWKRGSITTTAENQHYDMNQWALDNNITGEIEIKRIFYQATPAITRFMDSTMLNTTGVIPMDGFGLNGMVGGQLMYPLNYDLLRMQAIEMNDLVRRNAYSFELINNKLTIFPIPVKDSVIWFDYIKVSDRDASYEQFSNTDGLVTNPSNVPMVDIPYNRINNVGKDWIRRMTLVFAMRTLAFVRGKLADGVPFANEGERLRLNQADLFAQSTRLEDDLLKELRTMLINTSRANQLDRTNKEQELLNSTLSNIPLQMYIG